MTNILKCKIDDHRKTTDGKYIQGCHHTSLILNHKSRNKIIIKAVCDLRKLEDFDSIVCCGTSGLLVVPQIAELLNKHIVIVRKDERSYSNFAVEGVAPFRYVIIDDLICSGSTIRRIKGTIKEEYPRARCLGIYCYLTEESGYAASIEGSKLCEKDLGSPLLNLCDERT